MASPAAWTRLDAAVLRKSAATKTVMGMHVLLSATFHCVASLWHALATQPCTVTVAPEPRDEVLRQPSRKRSSPLQSEHCIYLGTEAQGVGRQRLTECLSEDSPVHRLVCCQATSDLSQGRISKRRNDAQVGICGTTL